MNKADSESIAAILAGAGHLETRDVKEADLIVVNTCNVREHAVKRVRGHVDSIKPRANNGLPPWIAVGGCVGEMEKASIFSSLPQVEIVFGTSSFHLLPEAITGLEAGQTRLDLTSFNGELPGDLPAAPVDPVREWLPISRGCDNFCSYCVVPYARGREHSLPADEIINRSRILSERGVREVTLLGQNVNSYGNDLGETNAFPVLLKRLSDVDGLRRLRFLTSHPKDMSDATIAAVAEYDKVCEDVHLPLQAGSDRILKLMNRGYGLADYLKLASKIRQAVPGVALSTDLIVGFPGETDAEFGQTLDAVREIRFDAAYTFIYSPRTGTAASKMNDDVPADEKESRLRRLITLQSELSLEINKRLVGETLEVFLEKTSRHGGGSLAGRTRTNKIVNCLAEIHMINRFVKVKIDGVTSASLKGTVCGAIE